MSEQVVSVSSPHSSQGAFAQHWIKTAGLLMTALILAGLIFSGVISISQAAPSAAPDAPLLSISISSVPNPGTSSSIAPGKNITYTLTVRNNGADPASNTVLTNTFPAGMVFVSANPPANMVSSQVYTWSVGTLASGGAQQVYTIIAQLPLTQTVLHERLTNQARATGWWNNSRYQATASVEHYVQNAGIALARTTSIIDTAHNNGVNQAVAGEMVTITAVFTVPQGIIAYNLTPRVLLQDGLWIDGASATYSLITTTANLDPRRRGNYASQLTFDAIPAVTDTNSGPQVFTYVISAHPLRDVFLETRADPKISDGATLFVQPIARWCEAPGCTVSNSHQYYYADPRPNTGDVQFKRPDVRPTNITSTYRDAAGIGQGNGQVRFTIPNTNQGGRPIAYDMVLTATLGPDLTYASSNGGNSWTVGDMTFVTWTVPITLAANQTWNAHVTVTLPSTFVVGTQFTCTAALQHESFPGDVTDEGVYVNTGSRAITPGVSSAKLGRTPYTGDNLTIGSTVTYTVITRLGAGALIPSPNYTDTFPLGFYYTSGSLQVQNATVTQIITGVNAASKKQTLGWYMDDIDNTMSGTPLYITATYRAELAGWDTTGAPVFAAQGDISGRPNAPNSAQLHWPGGSLSAVQKSVYVVQPYMRQNFSTIRSDPPYPNPEVGGYVNFQINFRNNSNQIVNAYDVHVCDKLPQGLAYDSQLAFNTGTCTTASIVSSPTPGDEEDICWIINHVCRAVDFNIQYRTVALPSAFPGLERTNNAYISDYSSQPGGTNDGNAADDDLPPGVHYDRHYADFPTAALPANAQCTSGCPFTVLGLAVEKTALQDSVAPNDNISYTISYQDTGVASYTGMVITDTYDAYVDFISADPAPTSHDPTARRLTWDIGNVPSSGINNIALTVQVKPTLPGTVTTISNLLMWDSDQTIPLTRTTDVSVGVANPHVRLSGPASAHAGQSIAYTVVYSNSGTAAQPVTLTLDYGPYLTFSSSTPAPASGDNVFVDSTLLAGGVPHTITIQLSVNAPLPYTLAQLDSSAIIATEGVPSTSDDLAVPLDRPILLLDKQGPAVPSSVGQPMQYTIHISNTGNYAATNLVITDTWGANSSYNSTNNGLGWTNHGTYATYQIATLAPGQGQDIDFWVNIDAQALFYINTVDLATDQTTTQSDMAEVWQESIATTKFAVPEIAFPGRVLTYTVSYTNTGGVANVVITDTLPAGFSYLGNSIAGAAGCPGVGWQAQQAGQNVTWTCTGLVADAQGQFQIWGWVTAAENTWLHNEIEAYGHDVLRPGAPLDTRVARPWLGVTKSAVDPRPAAPGDSITYTLVYSNYGSDTAYDVVIQDQAPANVTYASCDPAPCSYSGGVVTWDVGTVPTATEDYVTFVVVANAGTHGQSVVNSAYSIQSSLNLTDTYTGPAVSVNILDPHLTLGKAAEPLSVNAANDPITYTVTYTNDGGGTLTNVVITDTLSAFVAFDDSPDCTHSGESAGGTVTCTIGTVEQGANGAVEIYVDNITMQQGAEIINQAQGDSDQTALTSSNSTSVWFGCEPPSDPSFGYTPANPAVGQVVNFTGAVGGGAPVNYTWNFGDGETGSGNPITHTFAASDTFTVVMTATNACGAAPYSDSVAVIGGAVLGVDPTSLNVSLAAGGTATRTLTINNTGTANLAWSLAENPAANWLSEAPSNGNVPSADSSDVVVTFNAAGLGVGTYTTTLQISSNGGNASVPVTLNVPPQGNQIYLPLLLKNS